MNGAFGYEDVHAIAAELGRPISTLVALSDDNDPFLAGREGRRLDSARWFAELWRRLDIPSGMHLRRLHYILLSTTSITLPNGEPYENTTNCWAFLGRASANARYLGLVDPGAFVDRQAGEPTIYIPRKGDPGLVEVDDTEAPDLTCSADCYAYASARCDVSLPNLTSPELPSLALDQPGVGDHFAIEMWIEKSTANDVLLPLARRRGVTLVSGAGEISLTQCHSLVRRVLEHRRPTRILYISDFDPAGQGMPVSVARKIEFFVHASGEDLDIQLVPLVLTTEQVRRYRLPRTPIKDSDKRKNGFEEQHGEGAVELDALEALHPGELARIVNEAIDRFEDEGFDERLAEAADEARETLREVEQNVYARHADDISEAMSAHEAMKADVRDHIAVVAEHKAAFDEEMAEHIAAFDAAADECKRRFESATADHVAAVERATAEWREVAAPVWEDVAADLEEAAPAVEDFDWPEPEADEFKDPLYDSGRAYVEQMDRYKRHQGKPTERRKRNGAAS